MHQALQLLLKGIVEIRSVDLSNKLLVVNDYYQFKAEVTTEANYMDTYRQIVVKFTSFLSTLKMVKELEIKNIDAHIKLLVERGKSNVDNVSNKVTN